MRNILILVLDIYQKAISPALHSLLGTNNACRFSVTCSEYAKNKIEKEGVIKGSYYSLLRILKCQPFYNTLTN